MILSFIDDMVPLEGRVQSRQLLGLRDTATMTYGILRPSMLMANGRCPAGTVSRRTGKIFDWSHDILSSYGWLGYSAIKCWELLMVGSFLNKHHIPPKRSEFLDFTSSEFLACVCVCFEPKCEVGEVLGAMRMINRAAHDRSQAQDLGRHASIHTWLLLSNFPS